MGLEAFKGKDPNVNADQLADHIHKLRQQPALATAAMIILPENNLGGTAYIVHERLLRGGVSNYLVLQLRRDEPGMRTFKFTKHLLSEASLSLLRSGRVYPTADMVRVIGNLSRFSTPERARVDIWNKFADQLRTWSIFSLKTATGRDLPPEFKGNGNSDDLVLAFFFSYTAAKAWERFRNQLLANSYGNCTLPIEAGRDEPQLDDLYNMRFFV
ncbi:MAG TPA: hypothetical protein VKD22_15895 [Ramlibacter sp.]|nr:hypothetical protein [Ramlibacter sp.]